MVGTAAWEGDLAGTEVLPLVLDSVAGLGRRAVELWPIARRALGGTYALGARLTPEYFSSSSRLSIV